MPGRIYTLVADAVSETTAQSLIRATSPSDAVCEILKVMVTQETLTASEMLAIQIHRASTAGTGAAITARQNQEGDSAFGGTAIGTITADPTAGFILHRAGWNVLAPFEWHPTPEEEKYVSPSQIIVVHLDVAPSVAALFTTEITLGEIGG